MGRKKDDEEVSLDLTEETLEQAMLDAVELGEADYLAAILEKQQRPPVTLLLYIAYLKGSNVCVLETLARRGANFDDRMSLGLLMKTRERHP